MNDALPDSRPPIERLTPDDLPGLAIFIAEFLRDDSPRPLASAQQAAWEYVAEAELDELQELARDWDVLRAASRSLPLEAINRLLRERFASSWSAVTETEIEVVAAEFERALRE